MDNLLNETVIVASQQLQFLDYIDEKYSKDERVTAIVDHFFYERKSFSRNELDLTKTRPFACIQSTLGFLTPMIFFIRQELFEDNSKSFEINVKFQKDGKYIEAVNIGEIFRTLRNTIAHIFEEGNNIYLDTNGYVVFHNLYKGTEREIQFTTEQFYKFIMECIRRSREYSKEKRY